MMKRFIKKCEDFILCGGSGDANDIFTDGFPDNKAIYHIIVRGNVKMGRPFESEFVSLNADSNNFVDVRDYLYSKRVYTSSSPYLMYGFNPINLREFWEAKLVKESFEGDDKSWLICFKGKPIINDVSVKPMDYAKLDNKSYNMILNDAVVGVFTKL
tara:strand:- start:36 stop:506 length:471 start_codon:yes stop_codon:yes gene_type:complete